MWQILKNSSQTVFRSFNYFTEGWFLIEKNKLVYQKLKKYAKLFLAPKFNIKQMLSNAKNKIKIKSKLK